MTALFLQTALLLLSAYFVGTFLGCMLRRVLTNQPAHQTEAALKPVPAAVPGATPVAPIRRPEVEPVAPRIETIQRPTAPDAHRFERALAGSAPAPKPVEPVKPVTVAPIPAAMTPAAPKPAPVAPVAPAPVPVTIARPVAPAPVPPAPVAPAPIPATPVGAKSVAPPRPADPVPAAPVSQPIINSAAAAAVVAAAAAAQRVTSTPQPIMPAAHGSSGAGSVAAPIAPKPVVAPAPAPAPAPAVVVAKPVTPAAPVAAPVQAAAAKADDLTLIRAIDAGLQSKLAGLGVRRFADIAAWLPTDVVRMNSALGFSGRIEQENWIEQAQILAKGGETFYSRRKLLGEVAAAAPTSDEGRRATLPASGSAPAASPPAASASAQSAAAIAAAAAAAITKVLPATAPVAAAPVAPVAPPRVEERAAFSTPASPIAPAPITAPAATAPITSSVGMGAAIAAAAAAAQRPAAAVNRDELQRISGINAEVEKLLNVQGVSRYSQIAGWGPLDTGRFDRLLGYEGRVAREGWIEQAQVLARGGETAHSRDYDRRRSEANGEVPRPTRLADAIGDRVAAPAAAAPRPAAVSPAAAPVPAAPPAPAAAPVQTAAAAPSPASLAAAASAAVESERARADLSGMRSVKSEAYRSAEAAAPAAAPSGSVAAIASAAAAAAATATSAAAPTVSAALATRTRAGAPDDLKRIRGVGVLIEKKLNSMGITTYDQVANWSNADIEKVSQILDFKGRIERENWVEQARILSSGGQTEFSRRVDRGEVESSRGKPE